MLNDICMAHLVKCSSGGGCESGLKRNCKACQIEWHVKVLFVTVLRTHVTSRLLHVLISMRCGNERNEKSRFNGFSMSDSRNRSHTINVWFMWLIFIVMSHKSEKTKFACLETN